MSSGGLRQVVSAHRQRRFSMFISSSLSTLATTILLFYGDTQDRIFLHTIRVSWFITRSNHQIGCR